MTLVLESRGPADTRRVGERLARLLQAGDIVLMQGELGAGKTCLAQGIGKGLRVVEPVKSSSFILVNEYHGRLQVHHADLFRLNSIEEVTDLGLEENAADGLLLVEWPDRASGAFSPDHLEVRFDVLDLKTRRIHVTGHGARYEAMVESLSRDPKLVRA